MPNVIHSMLEGKWENYILPFFWQHGEDEAILRELVEKIDESHIKALCVESRPHPDFVGETWWRDMDIIMDECRKRNIEVWVLDDAKFPTGYANGRIINDFPEYRKLFLKEIHVDVIGPTSGTSLLMNVPQGDELYRVMAAKRTGVDDHVGGEMIDLTPFIDDDQIYWDVPEGYWRIFYMTLSHVSGHSTRLDQYLNYLTAEGTQVLIDEVYESHYQRYKDDFGKTFRGFFSDEPQFGNAYGYHASVGRVPFMSMPWSDGLEELLRQSLGDEMEKLLPGLWYEIGEDTWKVRYAYMDAMTKLYDKNFCSKIGDWCRERGVEYIGHVIEENNCHGRLGNGTGHFFRALWGQDMSGMDIVLYEIIPGVKGSTHAWWSRDFEADDEFFYYGLGQMCASLGHIDPKKKGRAMCENFGAYGWSEGLREMKWLTDFTLSRGINWYVPHAFTPKDFPDPDCPPHFYARGNNPQYKDFFRLMDYMNRCSNLINNGVHIASAAVLYHAEGEWAGENYMKFQAPVRVLAEDQIYSDIVPVDVIETAEVKNGKLCIVDETYGALLIPYAEAIPHRLAAALKRLTDAGLPVFFMNGKPVRYIDRTEIAEDLSALIADCQVVELEQAAQKLRELAICEMSAAPAVPDLRIYHYRQGETDQYLLFNESTKASQITTLRLTGNAVPLRYDACENKLYKMAYSIENGEIVIPVNLAAYEAMVITVNAENAKLAETLPDWKDALPEAAKISGPWKLSTATAKEYPAFTPYTELAELKNLNSRGMLPRFTGTIKYETVFDGSAVSGAKTVQLDLGEAGETAEVILNGENIGTCISWPYRLDVTGKVKAGENTLVVEVTNTLVYQEHDRFSLFQPVDASGLIGPVVLRAE